ncbi:hypothetical protein A2765_02815 [Candidatus Kaiserbacteria bacterium RIFCSPHIGHO2_01_FULL_56_24]|uniref:Peptidase M50 domain-containing protein n=1 Tax=Candidatus Kaiserbacteria bacterium RIFCSPHIGHO2_01_FULL_56_24 TaxID=1798487 RepID=A0A1F6DBB0_9BACT|nr:MAG: hypothetical protein A2765_02815 [Candidatus Kaiserbacteria bacterium RIFCSPHIGHO2_01_FULL_56_24]
MPQKASWGKIAMISLLILGKSAKLVKAVKIAKPAITFASMALSAFAYAFWLGPWFAIGLIAMLFIHEMGHVLALRFKGYAAPVMVFIPFLGAAIFAPKFQDRDNEAYVGYGGPLLGSIGAVMLFGVWFFLPADSVAAHLVLITSYAAVFLNLFNMMPVSPLDGGRITQAAGQWFQYVGVAALAIFSFFFREPVILFIWILVISELNFIKPKLKAIMAVLCAIGMTTLMYLGYSHQPWWVDAFDVFVATFLTFVMVTAVWIGNDEIFSKDNRPGLPVQRRIWWFLLYTGLTTALVLLLVYQSSLLPQVPVQ